MVLSLHLLQLDCEELEFQVVDGREAGSTIPPLSLETLTKILLLTKALDVTLFACWHQKESSWLPWKMKSFQAQQFLK